MTAAGILSWATHPTQRGPRANNSIRSRITITRQFLAYCRDNDIPAPNVTKALDRLQEAHPKLLGKVQDHYDAARLTDHQLHRLYAACQDGTWLGSRDQLAIRLLALGLRNTEARTLTWSCLQHDGSIQTIGKGGKLRTVFPGPTLTDQLDRWRRHYERTIGPPTGNAPILCTWPCNPRTRPVAGMGPRTMEALLRKRAQLAGLPHVAPHDLRRTMARAMYAATDQNGHRIHDIAEIADALGHSAKSLAVTQEAYIGPLNDTGRRAAGRLVD